MKKVLILDIESCADCPCSHRDEEHEWWCIAHTDGPKRIKGDLFDVTLEGCPLRPMPTEFTVESLSEEKQGITKLVLNLATMKVFADGYNACLEELNK